MVILLMSNGEWTSAIQMAIPSVGARSPRPYTSPLQHPNYVLQYVGYQFHHLLHAGNGQPLCRGMDILSVWLAENVHVRVMPLPRAAAVRSRRYGFTTVLQLTPLGQNLIAWSKMTSAGSAPVLDTGSR